jgi:phage terminase large subunit
MLCKREKDAAKRTSRKPRKRKRKFVPLKGYKPHAAQALLHLCLARIIVVCAGRRSGKTYAIAREFVRRVFEDFNRHCEAVKRGEAQAWRQPRKLRRHTKPILHYWIIAPTYDLTSVALREVFEILGGEESPVVLKWDEQLNRLWLRGGILIEIKSADRPDRLVSVGLNGVWADEAARLKADTWKENLEPVLAADQGWALFTSTPKGQNWYYQDLWQISDKSTDPERINPDVKAFHFTSAANTAKPALVEAAKQAKKDLPAAQYRRNYEADFFAFEGKIFEDFLDDNTHLIDKLPRRFKRVFAGLDFGFANPGALVVLGELSDGAMYVLDEVYKSNLIFGQPIGDPGADSWCKRIIGKIKQYGIEVIYHDPSSPGNAETLRKAILKAGLTCKVLPARNEVVEGIDAVAVMIKPVEVEPGLIMPWLKISRRCVNLRREMNNYQWKDNGSEAPVKSDDHACDALRYGLYSEHKSRSKGIARLRCLTPSITRNVA